MGAGFWAPSDWLWGNLSAILDLSRGALSLSLTPFGVKRHPLSPVASELEVVPPCSVRTLAHAPPAQPSKRYLRR
ncbi:hypothetical protein LX36DRAFT_657095 [Colletotrichum falcatum]|nr:hypothetical protein LX36DRAFT_657095 [Colletotrichum falcatum]